MDGHRSSFGVGAGVLAIGLVLAWARPGLPADPARRPQVWAVVVGIDRLDDPTIPPRPGMAEGGRRLAGWLSKEAGWGEGHVLLLTDSGKPVPDRDPWPPGEARATRKAIDRAVLGWVGERAGPDDLVLVAFAGYSARVARDDPAGAVDEFALLPCDVTASDRGERGWSPRATIEELVRRRRFRSPTVFWLDAPELKPAVGDRATSAEFAAWLDEFCAGPARAENGSSWPPVAAWLTPSVGPDPAGRPTFASALISASGEGGARRNLAACLAALRRDPGMAARLLLARGTLEPSSSAWAADLKPRPARSTELVLRRGHADRVSAIVFTADGSRMITASEDTSVKAWTNPLAERAGSGLPAPPALLQVFPGQVSGTRALALSPDERLLAIGNGLGGVQIHDLEAGRPEPGGKSLRKPVRSLAFLPDGRRLAILDAAGGAWLRSGTGAGTDDLPLARGRAIELMAWARDPGLAALALAGPANGASPILLFDGEGRPAGGVDGPGGAVSALALTVDGRLLASGDEEGRVQVRDLGVGRVVADLRPTEGKVEAIAFGPDGRLAIASSERVALFGPAWNLPGTRPSMRVQGRVDRLAFSDDARCLSATAGGRLTAWLVDPNWVVRAGAPLRFILRGIEDADDRPPIAASAFTPDGRGLVAGDARGAVSGWIIPGSDSRSLEDLTKRKGATLELPQASAIPEERGQVRQLHAGVDGRTLLQIDGDGIARAWDLEAGAALPEIAGAWSAGVALPGKGELALIDRERGSLAIVSREGGSEPGRRLDPPSERGPGWKLGRAAASPDGRWVAAVSVDGPFATAWDLSSGRVLPSPLGLTGKLTGVDVSADGRSLLIAGLGRSAKLWPFPYADASIASSVFPAPSAVNAVRFNPADPRQFAAGTASGEVLFRDFGVKTSRSVGRLEGSVTAVAFSADGKTLFAATDRSGIPSGWTLEGPGWRPMNSPQRPGHSGRIDALVALPKAALLASGGDDGTVRLWSTVDLALRATLVASPGSAGWVAYAPDGRFDRDHEGQNRVSFRHAGATDAFPMDRYFEAFYEQSLLARLVAGKLGPARSDLARLDGGRPPLVKVLPTRRDDRQPNRVTIRVEASDSGGGIGEVLCYRGRPGVREKLVPRSRSRSPERRVAGEPVVVEFDEFLDEGDNPLWVTAMGADRSWEAEPSPLTLRGAKLPPPRLVVVSVGISGYATNPLRFSATDASSVARAFRLGDGQAPYREVRSIELLERRATREGILEALRGVEVEAQDTLIVYLSGHGLVAGQQFHFVPYGFAFEDDGSKSIEGRGGISAEELLGELSRKPARNALLILDSCYSGAVELVLNRPPIEASQRRFGGLVLAASAPDAQAWEDETIKRSLLTHSLLQALESPDRLAIGPGGGILARSWLDAACRATPRLARSLNREAQVPKVYGELGDFELPAPASRPPR